MSRHDFQTCTSANSNVLTLFFLHTVILECMVLDVAAYRKTILHLMHSLYSPPSFDANHLLLEHNFCGLLYLVLPLLLLHAHVHDTSCSEPQPQAMTFT